MTITKVTKEIKESLRKSNFTPLFLDNCLNSKFLAIEKDQDRIVGICFVGGILNSNGIEVDEEIRGKGIGKKLLNDVIEECKKRNISFMTGVFKPSNIVSIKTHTKIGYIPLFTFHYNKAEGKEIVVILPFNKKGRIIMNLLKIFNTRIGNILFAIILILLRSALKNLIAFSNDKMPKIDFLYSIKNFERVESTLRSTGIEI